MKKKKTANDKNIARIARRIVQHSAELKHTDWPYSAVGANPNTGSTVSFNSVGYGSAAVICRLPVGGGVSGGSRTGNRCLIKGLQVYFAVQNGDTYNNFRFVICRNRGIFDWSNVTNGIGAIFSGITSSAQFAAPVDTNIVKVYYDKILSLKNQDSAGAGVVDTKFIKKFVKFGRGLTLQYDDTGSVANTDLYLVAVSDSAAVSHPGAIAGFVKLWWTDI